MKRISLRITTCLTFFFAAQNAFALSQVVCRETFSGVEQNTWFFARSDVRETDQQRNYLRNKNYFSYAAQATSKIGSCFSGNLFNARKISLDAKIFSVDFTKSLHQKQIALVLESDNNTPNEFADDWLAYRLHDTMTAEELLDWQTVRFEFPASPFAWPEEWGYLPLGPNSPAQGIWTQLIQQVRSISLYIGNPSLNAVFQKWDVGVSQIELTSD